MHQTIEQPVKIPFNEFLRVGIILNPCIITESGQQLWIPMVSFLWKQLTLKMRSNFTYTFRSNIDNDDDDDDTEDDKAL